MGFNRGQFNKIQFNLTPGGNVASTCKGNYDILHIVEKSLVSEYSIWTPTQIESQYDLCIAGSLEGKYDVTVCIEKGLDGKYGICFQSFIEGRYAIPHSAGIIGISSIHIPSPIEALFSLYIGQSVAGKYDIFQEGSVSKEIQGLFDICTLSSIESPWNILTARSCTGLSSILLEKELISFYELSVGNSLTGLWNTLISDQIASQYRIWDGPMDISSSLKGDYSILLFRFLKGTSQILRNQSLIGEYDVSSTYGITKSIIGLYDIESDYLAKPVIGIFSTSVTAECISSYNIVSDGSLSGINGICIEASITGLYQELYTSSYRTLWDIFKLPVLIGQYDIIGPLPDAPREIIARYDIIGVIKSSLIGLSEIKGTITNTGRYILDFYDGDSRLVGGMILRGAASTVRGQIGIVKTISGSWSAGTATGYILFDWVTGQFIPGESLIIEV
jgi:hypothetical protein